MKNYFPIKGEDARNFLSLLSKVRKHMRRKPKALTTGVYKTAYGFNLFYEETTYHATKLRKAVIAGRYEPDMLMVKKLIKPTDTVVDVGAHEGFFTLLLAQCAKQVYAIEPCKENLRYLGRNIEANLVDNVIVFPMAVGNTIGLTGLYYEDGLGAWASLDPDWGGGLGKYTRVEIDMLSNLLSCAHPISFIKIDTEGYEFNVLLGAKNILEDDKPHLCLEVCYSYWAMLGEPLSNMLNMLKQLGYKLFYLHNSQFIPYPKRQLTSLNRRVFNLYAFHCTKVADLEDLIGKEKVE